MLLLLTSLAFAAPTTTISGTCPGPVTLTVSGLTRGAVWALLTSPRVGTTTVPSGTCAGTDVQLANPGLSVMQRVVPPSGTFQISTTLPPSACGLHLQAIDLTTCTTSWPMDVGNPICNATANVGSAADITTYTPCKVLPDLVLAGAGNTAPTYTTLSLPNLVHTGSITHPLSSSISDIRLPALRTVTDEIVLVNLPGLLNLDLSRLTHIDRLALTMTSPLPLLPALSTVGTLDINGVGNLEASNLEEAETIQLRGDLYNVIFPSLRHINRRLEISGFARLQSVRLDNLESLGTLNGAVASAIIYGNTALADINLHGLTSIYGHLRIQQNPLLQTLDIDGLNLLEAPLEVTGNASLCPNFQGPLWPDFNSVTFGPGGWADVSGNVFGCDTW